MVSFANSNIVGLRLIRDKKKAGYVSATGTKILNTVLLMYLSYFWKTGKMVDFLHEILLSKNIL